MRTILLSAIVMLFTMALQAQELTISGTVSDKQDVLPGANIHIKNTDKGTTTDFDGNFNISVKPKDTLVFSYLGYTSQEIEIKTEEVLTITLEGRVALDEVIIEAYGNTSCFYKDCCCCSYIITKVAEERTLVIPQPLLYPNPSPNGQFQLRLDKAYTNGSLIVSTLTGKRIREQKFKRSTQNVNLDLSNYPSGIYLVSFYEHGKLVTTKKALKQ